MKRIWLFILLTVFCLQTNISQSETTKTALILIDIQNFYFPDGKVELVKPVEAAEKAAGILSLFRNHQWPIIHVKHKFEPGEGDIFALLKPLENEKIIVKEEVNAFNRTDLDEYLKSIGVNQIVIVGMQTHMCVEGAVRGGYDLGYKVILIDDACATRDLEYDNVKVAAYQVHASTLSTLKSYAKIFKTEDFVKIFPF